MKNKWTALLHILAMLEIMFYIDNVVIDNCYFIFYNNFNVTHLLTKL